MNPSVHTELEDSKTSTSFKDQYCQNVRTAFNRLFTALLTHCNLIEEDSEDSDNGSDGRCMECQCCNPDCQIKKYCLMMPDPCTCRKCRRPPRSIPPSSKSSIKKKSSLTTSTGLSRPSSKSDYSSSTLLSGSGKSRSSGKTKSSSSKSRRTPVTIPILPKNCCSPSPCDEKSPSPCQECRSLTPLNTKSPVPLKFDKPIECIKCPGQEKKNKEKNKKEKKKGKDKGKENDDNGSKSSKDDSSKSVCSSDSNA